MGCQFLMFWKIFTIVTAKYGGCSYTCSHVCMNTWMTHCVRVHIENNLKLLSVFLPQMPGYNAPGVILPPPDSDLSLGHMPSLGPSYHQVYDGGTCVCACVCTCV